MPRLVFDITYPYSKGLKDQGLAAAQALDMSTIFCREADKFNQGTFEHFEFTHENCWETDIPEQLTAHGRVCTDLWVATFVEYETLVDLVARTLPDTAKAVVDAYLSEQRKGTYGVMALTLEPGTHYLYHYGKHRQFEEMATAAGIALEQTIDEPYFLRSKD